MKEIKLNGLNESIFYDTCKNGLKVYFWVNKKVSTYYATLSVGYGSVYSNFKIKNKNYSSPLGVAHFLEHLKFNEKGGTTAHDYYNKAGCDTNAFTTFNYTNYQVLGAEDAKKNIMHLLDFVQSDYFTKKLVKNEKGIIIEEAKMGEDDPYTVMLFRLFKNMFPNYPYKDLITGSPKDVKDTTFDDIKLVFDTFYHPKNMFLVVTGNFNPYEIMEAVKKNQDKKEFLEYLNPKRIIPKENDEVGVEYEELDLNLQNEIIKIGIKIPRKNFKKYNEILIRVYLNTLLRANFGSTSLFKDELEENELIESLYPTMEIYDDYVAIIITINSMYKDEIINRFKEKLNNLDISEETFNRMKKANIASLVLDYEDVVYVNSVLQNEILSYDKIISNMKDIYEGLNYEEMQDILKCISTKNMSILVGNKKEEE